MMKLLPIGVDWAPTWGIRRSG